MAADADNGADDDEDVGLGADENDGVCPIINFKDPPPPKKIFKTGSPQDIKQLVPSSKVGYKSPERVLSNFEGGGWGWSPSLEQ